MKTNPPCPADAPVLAKMATIGIVPGKDFDKSKFKRGFRKTDSAGGLRPHHASIRSRL